MLTDPQTFYTGATAPAMNTAGTSRSFPRVSLAGQEAEYKFVDTTNNVNHILRRSHNSTSKGRNRHLFEYQVEKIAANALTSENEAVSAKVYMVIDAPPSGFTTVELGGHVVDFVNNVLQGSSTITKFIDGES